MVNYANLKKRIKEINNLQEDWDGYGAPKISKRVVSNANYLLDLLKTYGNLPEDIVPTAKGNISFEWGDSDTDSFFFAEISEEESLIYYVKDDEEEYIKLPITTLSQLDELSQKIMFCWRVYGKY